MKRPQIRLTPTGLEEPPSARGDWDTWKFCQTLTPTELQVYIGIIKDRLKYAEDGKENLDLRRQLMIVSDTYEIKSRNPSMSDDYNGRLTYLADERGTQLITYLGFYHTDIYYEELNKICKDIYNYSTILDRCKVYDEDLYATVLVSLIFDFYKTKYSEEELLSIFDVPLKEFIDLKIILKKWLDGNYWA